MAFRSRQGDSPSVAATVHIDADPQKVYALVTDLATLSALAEETVAMRWRKGGSACPGAVFTGHNENGNRSWSTTCTVTHAQPGRVFAFDVRYTLVPIARWRYDFIPLDGGCRVTEATWDRRPGWFRRIAPMATGVRDRAGANDEHIERTLQRLKERAEAI